ncbi:MAG: hypothetical protein ISS74_09615 [Planctomycetes bacterium]|nr:hypothetical protein [Planctomycetota bacterium]
MTRRLLAVMACTAAIAAACAAAGTAAAAPGVPADDKTADTTAGAPADGKTAAPADPFPVTAPPASMNLPDFYTKHVSAGGYPIVGSAKVSDYALKEAAYLVNMMLAKRPDVREAMIASGSRVVVMAWCEFTTDVPEHARLEPKAWWNVRARGLGGSATDPVCSCAEENLLAYPEDPYSTECILIHEFAHNMHLRGLVNVDPTFDRRLKEAWQRAVARGLWAGKYASVNHHEYWAEGVQSYFNNNREPDHDHNHVNTRKELREYDPALAKLCEEVFGDTELVYTKPATRLAGHLAGYDPSTAPTFRFPPGGKEIQAEIKAKARNRLQSNDDRPPGIEHEARDLEGWTVQVDKRLLEGEHADLGARALRVLANHLYEIARILPDDRAAHLRRVAIWLDLDHALDRLQYHPDAGWLRDHGYDTRMAKAVHIPQVRQYLQVVRPGSQPFAVLHELAHAYHDQVLGWNYPPIVEVYKKAVASKRYESVLRCRGRMSRHYALENAKEFFAEMTEAFLGTNDYWPFVQREVLEADPETHRLLESIWLKGEAPTPKEPQQ